MPGQIIRWKAEHANYRKLLDLLETQTGLFARGEQPNYELMADTVYYMTQYPDRFHHPREGIAFTALRAHDPTMREIIEHLAWEHQTIEKSGTTLATDLAAAAAGTMMPREMLLGDVRGYVEFLRRHLNKEEDVVFPRLAAALTTEDWFLVDSAIHFEADPLFGDSVQARFRALHQRIAAEVGCGCTDPVEEACCLK